MCICYASEKYLVQKSVEPIKSCMDTISFDRFRIIRRCVYTALRDTGQVAELVITTILFDLGYIQVLTTAVAKWLERLLH